MRAILCHPNDTFSLIIQSMKCVGPSVLLKNNNNITAEELLSLVLRASGSEGGSDIAKILERVIERSRRRRSRRGIRDKMARLLLFVEMLINLHLM